MNKNKTIFIINKLMNDFSTLYIYIYIHINSQLETDWPNRRFIYVNIKYLVMTTKSAQQNHFVAITKYFPQYINSKVLFYEELPTYGIHIT